MLLFGVQNTGIWKTLVLFGSGANLSVLQTQEPHSKEVTGMCIFFTCLIHPPFAKYCHGWLGANDRRYTWIQVIVANLNRTSFLVEMIEEAFRENYTILQIP